MIKVVLSPQASADMREIGDYIAHDKGNPNAARRLIRQFRESIARLARFPEMGSPLNAEGRQTVIYRYLVCGSHLVFYHIGECVMVDRVLYGRRDYLTLLFGDQLEEE